MAATSVTTVRTSQATFSMAASSPPRAPGPRRAHGHAHQGHSKQRRRPAPGPKVPRTDLAASLGLPPLPGVRPGGDPGRWRWISRTMTAVTTTGTSSTSPGRSTPVTPRRLAVVLGWIVALLAGVAAAIGLFAQGGPGPVPVTSLRGQPTDLYGVGLYRFDSTVLTLAWAPAMIGSAVTGV